MIIYIAVAAMSGLTILVLLHGLRSLVLSGSKLESRLQPFAIPGAPTDEVAEKQPDLSDRLNSYFNTRTFAGSIADKLWQAGVELTVPQYVLIKLAAALIPFVVFVLMRRSVLGIVFGLLCFLIPNLWLRRKQHRRQAEFEQQLPDTLTLIVGGLRAGFSLQHSLVNVAKQAPEPTAAEFKRIGQEVHLGVPLLQALDNLVQRMKSNDLEMIVSVFKIHGRVGGNLAAVVEDVGTTIRERVKLRRDIQVITSQQRITSYILGLLPPILGLVLFLINPGYMRGIFQWNIFLCIPIFALIMTVLGFLVIRKMADIEI